jgi:DNA-binding response OmpR family regulator
MAAHRFDKLRLVLGETNPDLSASIKDALWARGLRNVTTCRNTDKLLAALEEGMADLLVYDYDLPGEDFVEVTQRIRKMQKGLNPFVVVIATVKESQPETVKRLIEAGIDDLIRKPISLDRLFDRIAGFSKGRKPFVVTYNYVGPSRRVRARPDEAPETTIQVPNSIRAKVVDGVSDADLLKMVKGAVSTLDDKKVQACGIEINILSQRVASYYEGSGDSTEEDARGCLNRLLVVGEDLRDSCEKASRDHLVALANMEIALVKRVLNASEVAAKREVLLLANLAAAIHRALSVEHHAVDVMKDIADTIAKHTGKS